MPRSVAISFIRVPAAKSSGLWVQPCSITISGRRGPPASTAGRHEEPVVAASRMPGVGPGPEASLARRRVRALTARLRRLPGRRLGRWRLRDPYPCVEQRHGAGGGPGCRGTAAQGALDAGGGRGQLAAACQAGGFVEEFAEGGFHRCSWGWCRQHRRSARAALTAGVAFSAPSTTIEAMVERASSGETSAAMLVRPRPRTCRSSPDACTASSSSRV